MEFLCSKNLKGNAGHCFTAGRTYFSNNYNSNEIFFMGVDDQKHLNHRVSKGKWMEYFTSDEELEAYRDKVESLQFKEITALEIVYQKIEV